MDFRELITDLMFRNYATHVSNPPRLVTVQGQDVKGQSHKVT